MSYTRYIYIFCFIFSALGLYSQCFPDRHNTSTDEAWLSCTPSLSPYPERGVSHWIMYDIGSIQELGRSTIWNYNTPGEESNGIQELIVDYSNDGLTWQTYGSHTLEEISASSFYQGDEGPDLSGLSAQFILFTAVSNFGGDCFGMAEIKIEVGNLVSNIEDTQISNFSLVPSPNPASDIVALKFETASSIDGKLTISNSLGQQVYIEQTFIPAGTSSKILNLASLTAGVYIIAIQSGDKMSTSELIITR